MTPVRRRNPIGRLAREFPGLHDDLGWMLGALDDRVTKQIRQGLARWEAARLDHPGGVVTPRNAFRKYATLAALQDGREFSQLDLSRTIRVNQSTLVAVLDEMEQAGLVTRRVNPSDRRNNVVACTPAGTTDFLATRAAIRKLEVEACAPLPAERRQLLASLLREIISHDLELYERGDAPE